MMLTRWGRELDPEHPLPEHPRPQLARTEWVSLNGRWEYAFTASAGRPPSWDGEIVVPFSPEAPLSGVGRQLQPDEWLWYRRRIDPPEPPPGGRVLLHFGAVDQSCTVFLDGTEIGGHTGGYLPFTVDVTAARPGSVLEVRVRDLSETSVHARGKQRLDRGGIWYTAQSGIWQTVWLEPVPREYVGSLRIVPQPRDGVLEVTVVSAGTRTGGDAPVEIPVEITVGGRTTSTVANHATRIALADPRPWSPEDPFLHDLDIVLGSGRHADRVSSYAALRSFGVAAEGAGPPRLLLNGEPYQHVGVLDQGYWPDGLMTPPSDAAMVHDIETMKACGFTMLRKHAQVAPLRFYAHCDRIGMLVWQDVVNGGGRYRHLVTTLPAARPVPLRDRWYPLFKRADAAGRAEFREEVRQTVALLGNSPCVAVWVPFNEGWGQFDANDVAAEVARLDPTRQVDAASGWIDQGGGDIRSWHCYVRPWRMPRRRRGDRRVLALSEYGGYTLRVPGHAWSTRAFGYRRFPSAAALALAFERLHAGQVAPTVRGGIAATVYTQLSDVEDELNGLLTYDREVLKIPAERIRAALAGTRPG
ncbi:MAG TPA: glycoside hydrolase family 2 [Marmoricola sp.]|nr:glycoside hydrolase family 2 [Marmoricola sp.]